MLDLSERILRLPPKGLLALEESLQTIEFFRDHPPAEPVLDYRLDMRYLRGWATWELVAEKQRVEDDILALEAVISETELRWAEGYLQGIASECKRRTDIPKVAEASNLELRALKEMCLDEDFVRVCGHYVEVMVVGGERKYRCHLHGKDTNPSGYLYSLQGRWWCFGCNQGGDVFDFLMRYGRLTFGEAVGLIGKLYGVEGRGNGG